MGISKYDKSMFTLLDSPTKLRKHGSILKDRSPSPKKRVGFQDQPEGPTEMQVVFKIWCEAMDEYHAVKILLNSHVKFEDKIIKNGEPTEIEVSQELENINYLNNTLTFID